MICPTILNTKCCNTPMVVQDINYKYTEYACPRNKCGTRIAISTALEKEEAEIARYEMAHPRYWEK